METAIHDIPERLEQLARLLVSGRHDLLERSLAELEPSVEALKAAAAAAQTGRPPAGACETCLEIRRGLRDLHELLEHADQVRAGLMSLMGLLYEDHAGARYSAHGSPHLTAPPRLLAEA
jgi:hypothetical protein